MTPEGIKAIREAYGFTVEDFANALGVTPTTVKNWESGVCRAKKDNIYAIIELLAETSTTEKLKQDARKAVYIGDLSKEGQYLVRKLVKDIRDTEKKFSK